MPPPALRRDTARQWAVRVPSAVLSLGPALIFLGALVAFTVSPGGAAYPATMAQATSWTRFAENASFGVVAVACLVGTFAPRVAALGGAALVFATSLDLGRPFAWIGVAWLALLLLDVVLASRQARRWPAGPVEVPDLGLRRWTPSHLVASAALVLAVAVGLATWVHVRGDLLGLDARSVPARGTVVSTDASQDSVRVRVEGHLHDFWVEDSDGYSPRDHVTVRVDPTGQERPYGLGNADQDDWSLLAVPIGAVATAALLFASARPLRIATLRRRARRGRGASVTVLEVDLETLDLGPVDDVGLRLARLTHLRPLGRPSAWADEVVGHEEEDEERADDEEDDLPEPLPALLVGPLVAGGPALVRIDLQRGPVWLATIWPVRQRVSPWWRQPADARSSDDDAPDPRGPGAS